MLLTMCWQAIDAKSVVGRHDTSLFLKAQMDNLQGRNDELRLAIREIRHESNTATLERDKAMDKVSGSYPYSCPFNLSAE